MADQMDVDADAMSGEINLQDDKKHMLRDGDNTIKPQEEDLIELPESKQKGASAAPHMGQGGQRSEGAPVKRQRTLLHQSLNVIGLTSFRRGNQQGPGTTDAKRLRVRLQVSEAEKLALQKTIDELQAQIGLVQQDKQTLDQWNRHGQKEYGKLVNKYNDLNQNAEREKEDHRKEKSQLKGRVNDLVRTNDRLRQMIVPVSEKQVLDSELVSRFTRLRADIVSLVRQTWKTEWKENIDVRQLSTRQKRLFRSPIPLSYDRLRCMVFNNIHGIILGSQRYFLQDKFQEMEQHIQEVEKGLGGSLSGGDRGQILDWRNATFKATETLRNTDNNLSTYTRNRIWSLLAQLQTKSAAAEQTGKAKLEAICKSAVELSLMLRQLKDEVWVDSLHIALGQRISGWEDVADDMQSVPVGPDHPTGTVAYVITGALLKRPKEDMNRLLVLEKAEVAVVE